MDLTPSLMAIKQSMKPVGHMTESFFGGQVLFGKSQCWMNIGFLDAAVRIFFGLAL